ncbi:MAG TPA: hypothetical protein VNA25_13690 [Phycisphaerae bacterium]|nr:hypothetical protein [Planctomycetota bacterium]HUT58894.1 hypothetical protein [Phycisphaerae bacterium]
MSQSRATSPFTRAWVVLLACGLRLWNFRLPLRVYGDAGPARRAVT